METNAVVEKHNIWTLTKHVAVSINKGAGKVDKVIYGNKTNVVVVPTVVKQPKFSESHPILCGVGIVLVVCAGAAIWLTWLFKSRPTTNSSDTKISWWQWWI